MVQNAFEVMNVEVVAISHFVGNEPSRKVIERAGFIFEGVMPCGFKRFDGEVFDNVCYSILRSEYDTGLFVRATHAVKLTNKCACPYSVRKLWKYPLFFYCQCTKAVLKLNKSKNCDFVVSCTGKVCFLTRKKGRNKDGNSLFRSARSARTAARMCRTIRTRRTPKRA